MRTVSCFGFALCLALCFTLSAAKMDCDPIVSPRFGIMDCTNGDVQGSICTLKCQQYFDLDDTIESEIESVCQADSTWSVPSFGCTAIKCDPPHTAPENGDVICTADNFMDSMCVFQCNELYDMVGVKDMVIYSMCKDDGDGDAYGRWYTPFRVSIPPVCKPMICSPNFTNPENGQIICSAKNYAGSFCVVNCNEGYDLVGTDDSFITTTCRDDRNGDKLGKWDVPEPQVCKLPDGTCDIPLKSKEVIYQCDSSTYVPGTKCTMKCIQSTHYLVGSSHIECSNSLKWVVSNMARCVECNGVKRIQIISLIHTANTRPKLQLAAKVVTRIITYVQRKKFTVDLDVMRFNSVVDTKSQFSTSPLNPKEHKKILEGLPYSGTGEDTAEALAHAYDVFEDTMENNKLKVIVLITDEMKVTDEAVREARNLRDEGVTIAVFKLAEDVATMEYLEKLTGSKDLIFKVKSPAEVERQKSIFYDKIYVKALEKGCEVNH